MTTLVPVVVALLLVFTGRAFAGPAGVTVYLNRNGAVIVGADEDDSAARRSAVVGRGHRVKVPAWKGGDDRWAQMKQCVEERFADFNIEITDQQPAEGEYIMAMVGGKPGLLGYGGSVAGVSLADAGVISNAIVFVFSDTVDSDAEDTCVDVLHEVGHALGLDHQYLCSDPMTYLDACGPQTFQDIDAPCGEEDERECASGEATQNSWRQLAAAVGLRGRPAPSSVWQDEELDDNDDWQEPGAPEATNEDPDEADEVDLEQPPCHEGRPSRGYNGPRRQVRLPSPPPHTDRQHGRNGPRRRHR